MNGLHAIGRDERGVAAVELGLLAPVLALLFMLTVDVGMAVNEKMAVDHVMRVGAEAAMADPGEDLVQNVLEQTAGENFGAVADAGYSESFEMGADAIFVGASRFCACPTARAVAVPCSGSCSGEPPLAFYRLEGHKAYSGIFLSTIEMDTALQVQVK